MEQTKEHLLPQAEAKEQVLKAAAIPCLNCGELLGGHYCVSCGQRSDTHRLSLHHILHDVWHSFTHTDLGLLHLVKELSYRPGLVAQEFAAGQRKKYFNPWTFFILASALYVFAATSSGYLSTFGQQSILSDQELSQKAAEQMSNLLQKNLKELNFLSIPLLALGSWLLFRKSGFNYAENLVFQAYIYGWCALLFCVVCLPLYLAFPKSLQALNIGYALASFGYSVVASQQFFHNGWGITLLKSVLLYIFNFLLLLIPFSLYFAFFVLRK